MLSSLAEVVRMSILACWRFEACISLTCGYSGIELQIGLIEHAHCALPSMLRSGGDVDERLIEAVASTSLYQPHDVPGQHH